MSKVLLDHMPTPTPVERRVGAGGPSPQRSRVEAGVLGVVIAGILVFAAGFTIVFPESIRSPAFWPSYGDPAGTFELHYPRGWTAEDTANGAIFRAGDDGMVVAVTRLEATRTNVDRLAGLRAAEIADLGAAEAVREPWAPVSEHPTAAIRELSPVDGTVTTRVYIQAAPDLYLIVAATAPQGEYDAGLLDRMLGTIALLGPDADAIDDRVSQSRP